MGSGGRRFNDVRILSDYLMEGQMQMQVHSGVYLGSCSYWIVSVLSVDSR